MHSENILGTDQAIELIILIFSPKACLTVIRREELL